MKGTTQRVETVVIGGGQAGLSVGYFLARQGRRFTILDANQRVGDAWRNRWDSLRLFTPARYCGLAGMPFPGPPHAFPSKDEMAAYLESYASHFSLPVRNNVKVDGVARRGDRYLVTAGEQRIEADHVVIAMSRYQAPKLPRLSLELRPDLVQLHSLAYRNPRQLQEGAVLIVGAGNSGADIALDVARSHKTWLAGRNTGQVPFRIGGLAARLFLQRIIFRVVFHRILTNNTRWGRQAKPKVLAQGGPLIRVREEDLKAAGVERVPRVVGTHDGSPLLEDGRILSVSNVIWCTGYEANFSWIRLPIFEDNGMPKHESGVALGEPGIYFVGLPFISAFSSTMIHGLERDAQHVVSVIEQRVRARPQTELQSAA